MSRSAVLMSKVSQANPNRRVGEFKHVQANQESNHRVREVRSVGE